VSIDCTDPWHDDESAPHIEVVYRRLDGWEATGFRCRTCGLQTLVITDECGNEIAPDVVTHVG